MDVRSDVDEETENQRAELGGHHHLNARGILARTRYEHTHTYTPYMLALCELVRYYYMEIE